MAETGGRKILCENRKARFNYHILETYEAGIVLTGAEIKSVRLGQVSLEEAFIRPDHGDMYLLQAHIQPYNFNTAKEYDPVRRRKLLLHRKEIDELQGAVDKKGLTIVPLRMYLKRGFAKLEIALVKGKAAPDKRQAIKGREAKREAERALKSRR